MDTTAVKDGVINSQHTEQNPSALGCDSVIHSVCSFWEVSHALSSVLTAPSPEIQISLTKTVSGVIREFSRKVFSAVEEVALVVYWEDKEGVTVKIVFPDFVEKIHQRHTLYDLQLSLLQENRGMLFDFGLVSSAETFPETAVEIPR